MTRPKEKRPAHLSPVVEISTIVSFVSRPHPSCPLLSTDQSPFAHIFRPAVCQNLSPDSALWSISNCASYAVPRADFGVDGDASS